MMQIIFIFPTVSEIPSCFHKGKIQTGLIYPLKIMGDQPSSRKEPLSSSFFLCAGVGKKSGKVVEKLWHEKRFDLAVLMGCSGGLTEDLKAGDIVICDRFLMNDKKPISSDRSFCEKIRDSLFHDKIQTITGASYTVPKVVSDIGTKRNLANKNAMVIEMENYWIAQTARRFRIPFVSLRVVLDTLHDSLPDMEGAVTPDGQISIARTLKYLCRHPSHLYTLARIGLLANKVVKRIKLCVDALSKL